VDEAQQRLLVQRVLPAALGVVEEFADRPVEPSVVVAKLDAILFGKRELFGCQELGLITSREYVDAVAAHLVSLALAHREPPHPRFQVPARDKYDELRRVLLG